MSEASPRLTFGDFFLATNKGGSPREQLLPILIRWGTNSPVNHAGIYVGGGKVVEAQPSGAQLSPVEQYLGSDTTWSRGAFIPLHDELETRQRIIDEAAAVIGTPYGFADIVAIALAQTRLHKRIDPTLPMAHQPWWARRLMDTDTMICSQLCDEIYRRAGVHLFNDGRLPQLCSPGDLYRLLKGQYA